MKNLNERLTTALLDYDDRLAKRERSPNVNRIVLLLEALDRAVENPNGIEAGIRDEFLDDPADSLLRVVAEAG